MKNWGNHALGEEPDVDDRSRYEKVARFQIDFRYDRIYNQRRACMINQFERMIVMKDYSATGNYYVIGHLVQFTGLTDRTIRNYISLGILEGEKINGLWHFTPEQVEAFVRHPAVRPSILAKRNAVVYDFLINNKKERHQSCIILDLPGEDEKNVAEFFCDAIGKGDFHDFRFSFDCLEGVPRVILKGETKQVLELVGQYYMRRNMGAQTE